VHAKPAINAGPDKVIFKGDSVTLNATVDADVSNFYWNPPQYLNNNLLISPSASPPSDISYTLYGSSVFGCDNTDEVKIKVIPGIFVPSAFTPNGDTKNDRWHIANLDPLLNAEVSVFNRYGQLVYHVRGGIADWDGNYGGLPQAAGAYVYYIRYKKSSGEVNLKGTVVLIR
jgi:gliding motility-associated-like protein